MRNLRRRVRSLRYKEGETEKNVKSFYVDANCELSNDPPDYEASNKPLHLCNIRKYQCQTSDDVEDVVIPYNYEVFYDSTVDFELVRGYLEESMLEHIASATGTIQCAATASRRRRLSTADGVVGVSVDPQDVPDDRFDSCSTEFAGTTDCRPMIGGMSISLTQNADREAITQRILDALRQSMGNDIYVVPGTIEQVTFIENRTVAVAGASETDRTINAQSDDGGGGGVSAMALGMAGGAIGLILLVMAAFTARRRRKESVEVESLSLDGSLAHRDSLALQPHAAEQDCKVPAEEEEDVHPPSSLVTGDLVVVGRNEERVVLNVDSDVSFENADVCRDGSLGDTQPDVDADRLPTASQDSATEIDELEGLSIDGISIVESSDDGEANDDKVLANYGSLQARAVQSAETPSEDTEGKALSLDELDAMALPMEDLSMLSSRQRSTDYSGFLAEARSMDYETGSDCTPRRVLQMQ